MSILSKNNEYAATGRPPVVYSTMYGIISHQIYGDITYIKCGSVDCVKCRAANYEDRLRCPSCGMSVAYGESTCNCGAAVSVCARGVVKAVSIRYDAFKNEDDVI